MLIRIMYAIRKILLNINAVSKERRQASVHPILPSSARQTLPYMRK